MKETVIDITGIELTPYRPEECKGNGETRDNNGNIIECCCDECDYYLGCFPNTLSGGHLQPERKSCIVCGKSFVDRHIYGANLLYCSPYCARKAKAQIDQKQQPEK